MAKKLVETLYGKSIKYEIFKDVGVLSTTFSIYRDGKYWKMTSELGKAVEMAKKGG